MINLESKGNKNLLRTTRYPGSISAVKYISINIIHDCGRDLVKFDQSIPFLVFYCHLIGKRLSLYFSVLVSLYSRSFRIKYYDIARGRRP